MYKYFLKRIFDFIISLAGIICLSPVLLIVTILLLFANKGHSVFFVQDRPGKNAKVFKVIKFKTMTDQLNADGIILPDAMRLTKTGRIVRSLSIDEIPQLFNVLIGDMSLIGPRPLLARYLTLYNAEQSRRHEVRPGITGWAQVNGRNTISWEEKFKFDVWYVDNISLLLDVKILVSTISNVLLRKGISADNQATMQAFKGNTPDS